MNNRFCDHPDEKWIDKLIGFFRRMPRKAPDCEEADYSGWDLTEEQYQQEQAKWLKKVRECRQKKQAVNGKSLK